MCAINTIVILNYQILFVASYCTSHSSRLLAGPPTGTSRHHLNGPNSKTCAVDEVPRKLQCFVVLDYTLLFFTFNFTCEVKLNFGDICTHTQAHHTEQFAKSSL